MPATSTAAGFSTKTCFFAFTAASPYCAWNREAQAIMTTSQFSMTPR